MRLNFDRIVGRENETRCVFVGRRRFGRGRRIIRRRVLWRPLLLLGLWLFFLRLFIRLLWLLWLLWLLRLLLIVVLRFRFWFGRRGRLTRFLYRAQARHVFHVRVRVEEVLQLKNTNKRHLASV